VKSENYSSSDLIAGNVVPKICTIFFTRD